MRPLREMSFAERGREIKRLRREIERWALTYKKGGNERCHEVDQRLADNVGIRLYSSRRRRRMTRREFRKNCDHYADRECRAGRLIDDR